MEQTTPLFEWFRRTYPQSIGSEYLGTSIPFGEFNARGIRNERATHLTFASAQFDRVISLDVLEHIPDFRHALAECRRVLRPGGMLLLSVPFRTDRHENMLRAIVEYDGSIRHLEPPEYHGDPLRAEGCLAFHHFGWEFLDQLRSLEFDADAYTYWSRELGYLGARQLLFIAKRRVPDEVPRRGTLL